jgi:Flp pilus assembly protein TadD
LHLSTGLLLLNGQRPQEAIAELEEALALGAEPAVHQHLAAAYDALGRPDDARRHQALFERSLVAAPRRP